jgi:hypothetical protein
MLRVKYEKSATGKRAQIRNDILVRQKEILLNRLPWALARLASLQRSILSECVQLIGDLSLLATLTSLQTLNLFGCQPPAQDQNIYSERRGFRLGIFWGSARSATVIR